MTSGSLFRHSDFLKLWSAETISVFGTAVTQLALPLVAAVTLGVGPFEFGLLTTIEFLPFILLSLPAGVWVDRLRRRPILIAGDLGRAVTLGSIPAAFAFDVLAIWQLYAVAFLTGCHTVFFDVAYRCSSTWRTRATCRPGWIATSWSKGTRSSRSRVPRRRSLVRGWVACWWACFARHSRSLSTRSAICCRLGF